VASAASSQSVPRVPAAVRRAATVVAVEGVLLGVVAGWLVVLLFTREETDTSLAVVEIVVVAAAGALLVALGRGLWRGNAAARTPVVVMQVLATPVGWTLLGGGQVVLGLVVLGLAVAVLALLLGSASAREALARGPGAG